MLRFYQCLLLFFIVLLTAGCGGGATKPFEWKDTSIDMVWPKAPDIPRVRYLRDLSGPEDIAGKNEDRGLLTWLLGEPDDKLPLLSPFSVGPSLNGSIWVADNGSRMLYRFDTVRGNVDYFTNMAGVRLDTPIGVVVDDERQRVYLSDAGNRQVFVLNSKGEYQFSIAPQDGFKRPAGLALGIEGELFVADAMAGVVYVFEQDGKLTGKIASKVTSDGLFRRPISVAVSPSGEVLVLDAMAFRVEVQSPKGELVSVISKIGDSAGSLARPKGLAVDQFGHVYISDAAFDNIQVFDLTGRLLMYFGGSGRLPGQFNLPAGLSIDSQGRLFAADSYNHRVQVFSLLH